MTSSTPPLEPEPQVSQSVSAGESAAATSPSRGFRIPPKLILAVVILAAVLWFVFANTSDAKIKLWVHTVSVPVWMVLLGTLVAGIIIGWLLGRRRRRPRT